MEILTIIILAGGAMLVLGLFMAYVLGWANRTFHVAVDPRVEQIIEALPGTNCGGCGFAGCSEYAEAVATGEAPPDKCTVGGQSCAAELAGIIGVEVQETCPHRPVVHCGATCRQRLGGREYRGERTCGSANMIPTFQGCAYGCFGFSDCVEACGFDAIHIIDGLAVVDYEKCVGCGACVGACPRNIISMAPFKSGRMLAVLCSNKDFGKDVKAVCEVGCIGCKACARVSDLFEITDNLPEMDYDRYDPKSPEPLDAAAEKCPTKCLVFVGEPADKPLAAVASQEAHETAPEANP